MVDDIYVGNANIDAAGDRGWLLGHFKAVGDPRHSAEVEIKWGVHPPGDRRAQWVTGEKRTALLILISGRFRVELPNRSVLLAQPGDYVVWGHGVDHSWYAEEESVVLTVRWPSIPGYAVASSPGPAQPPEPSYLAAVRASYDTVAEDYAKLVPPRFAADPLGRGMLAAFAELVQAGGRPVADLGCGPGHVTAHLDSLGVPAFGVDLSPKMVEVARRTYPSLRFEVGSMTALDLNDGEVGGIVAWWSILHLPPAELPAVFAEFHRALAPGGHVLLGFHVGDEHLRPERSYGHPVSYDTYLLLPDRIEELLSHAGMSIVARLIQEPGDGLKRAQACLLARKPER